MKAAWHIMGLTWRDLLRQRLLLTLVFLALSFLVLATFMVPFSFGNAPDELMIRLASGAISVVGMLLALYLPADQLFRQWQDRTIIVLWAHPVSRSNFLWGTWLGIVAVLLLFLLLYALSLLSLLLMQGSMLLLHLDDWLRALVLQAGKLGVLAALTLWIASFAQSMVFTTSLAFVVYCVGHLHFLAQHIAEEGTSWYQSWFAGFVQYAIPNFQGYPQLGDVVSWSQLAYWSAYSVSYLVLYLLLAAWFLRSKEA